MRCVVFLYGDGNVSFQVPTVIVQGRYDVVCPVVSAWELHKALPQSVLHLTTTGHSAFEPDIVERLVAATDGFR